MKELPRRVLQKARCSICNRVILFISGEYVLYCGGCNCIKSKLLDVESTGAICVWGEEISR